MRRAMGMPASDDEVKVATFLAWSTVHGASLLWLDGPMHRHSAPAAKKSFLALADAAIRKVARSIARGTDARRASEGT